MEASCDAGKDPPPILKHSPKDIKTFYSDPGTQNCWSYSVQNVMPNLL